MKHSVRSIWFLLLAVCALTVTAFADMGPKDQLTVKVENPPQEVYWLDLLAEGNPSERYPLPEDDFHFETNLKELGFPNADLYYAMNAAVPEGWHACLTQPSGPPIWGSLTDEESGDSMLHSFRYFGVPTTYRILILTESGEVWISAPPYPYRSSVLHHAGLGDKRNLAPPSLDRLSLAILCHFHSHNPDRGSDSVPVPLSEKAKLDGLRRSQPDYAGCSGSCAQHQCRSVRRRLGIFLSVSHGGVFDRGCGSRGVYAIMERTRQRMGTFLCPDSQRSLCRNWLAFIGTCLSFCCLHLLNLKGCFPHGN